MPSLTSVSWRDGRLALHGASGDVAVPGPRCGPDERYDVRLGGGWLLAPGAPGVAALRVDADPAPAMLPPGLDDSPPAARSADPSGALLVLAADALHVLESGVDWARYPLPVALRPRCAALAAGVPWVGGLSASERRRAERRDAELVRWSPAAGAFVAAKPRLGFTGALRAVAPDRFAAIDGIEASGEPAVLWAAGRDPAAPGASLLVLEPGDRWRVHGTDGTVRTVHRLGRGRLLVVTAEGELLLLGDRLRGLPAAAAIRAHALAGAPAGARVVVRGSDALGDRIALVAGAYTVVPAGALTWHRTVVLDSHDGGTSWTCERATAPAAGEPELLDVALAA